MKAINESTKFISACLRLSKDNLKQAMAIADALKFAEETARKQTQTNKIVNQLGGQAQ